VFSAPPSYQQPQRPPAPYQFTAPQNARPSTVQPLVTPNRPNQTQQHLAGWMEQHRTLPLAEQQRALENEPGFRTLPPQEQQKLRQRLMQLNQMPPEQVQKQMNRVEDMERLQPAQRQQVRNAMAQLGSLPEYRRHVVNRAFFQIRDMPPGQREAYLNSPQFRAQFNDQERGAIYGLLNITPIWPPLQAPPQYQTR
jgi:hypothetical protein